MAAGEEDGEVWMAVMQFAGKILARYSFRHHNIRNHERHPISDLRPEFQRFPARYRLDHVAAEDFKELANQFPNRVFVFDEKDRHAAEMRLNQTLGARPT